MADRPIIFSAPMIAALLAGRKTQTRRILKPQPDPRTTQISVCRDLWMGCGPSVTGGTSQWDRWQKLRFAVDDRLYVRENHALVPSSAYRMSEGVEQTINPGDRDLAAIYAAGWDRSKPRWRPSIHMPRWASRLTLLVTDVRVERLQDISEADAKAEGIRLITCLERGRDGYTGTGDDFADTRVEAFRNLWTSLHGRESWAASPWIVAVTFSVHARNIDQLAPIAEVAA